MAVAGGSPRGGPLLVAAAVVAALLLLSLAGPARAEAATTPRICVAAGMASVYVATGQDYAGLACPGSYGSSPGRTRAALDTFTGSRPSSTFLRYCKSSSEALLFISDTETASTWGCASPTAQFAGATQTDAATFNSTIGGWGVAAFDVTWQAASSGGTGGTGGTTTTTTSTPPPTPATGSAAQLNAGECPSMPAAYSGDNGYVAEQRSIRREQVAACLATIARLDSTRTVKLDGNAADHPVYVTGQTTTEASIDAASLEPLRADLSSNVWFLIGLVAVSVPGFFLARLVMPRG